MFFGSFNIGLQAKLKFIMVINNVILIYETAAALRFFYRKRDFKNKIFANKTQCVDS